MRIFAVFCAALITSWVLASARADEKPAESGPDPAALFAELDANKDGVVSADEIPDDKKRLFERLVRIGDKNSDGKLSAEEFAEGLKPRQQPVGLGAGGDDDRGPKRFFKRLDANGDGKVTLNEIPEERRERFERLIKRGDKDGDGALSLKEFVAVTSDEEPAKPAGKPPEATPSPAGPGPEQLFKRMDRNGDGKVTLQEIPENRRPMVERMIKRGDKDGDGALSRDEFTSVMERFRQAGEKQQKKKKAESAAPPVEKPAEKSAVQPAAALGPAGGPPPGSLFAMLDANHDGQLSSDEIAAAAEIIRKLDRDGDGKVSFEEIVANAREQATGK